MKATPTLSDYPFALGNALLRRHRRAIAKRRRIERRQAAFGRMRPALEIVGVLLASSAAGWLLVLCMEIIGRAAAVLFASLCP